MSILKVDNLEKTFGRRRVVDGVSLTVQRGEIVGLLGPNGAGKSTTFKMICGLLNPDKGRVTLADKDVTKWPMFERARNGGMGYLPQQSSIFGKLTVQQNLLLVMQLLNMSRKEQKDRCQELLGQFKIEKVRKSRASKLSGGERRRLEIARCLVSNPEIIMLDEPFAGIDPVTVQNIRGVIEELRDSGIAILITDHAADQVLQTTDRTYVVSEGRILCSGTAEEIVQHDEVKRKYLGEIEFSKIKSKKKPVEKVAKGTGPADLKSFAEKPYSAESEQADSTVGSGAESKDLDSFPAISFGATELTGSLETKSNGEASSDSNKSSVEEAAVRVNPSPKKQIEEMGQRLKSNPLKVVSKSVESETDSSPQKRNMLKKASKRTILESDPEPSEEPVPQKARKRESETIEKPSIRLDAVVEKTNSQRIQRVQKSPSNDQVEVVFEEVATVESGEIANDEIDLRAEAEAAEKRVRSAIKRPKIKKVSHVKTFKAPFSSDEVED